MIAGTELLNTAARRQRIPLSGKNDISQQRFSPQELKKLKEACKDFESLFIKQMLNTMRKTVHKSGLIDGGMAEEYFEDMLYDKYADRMSETAGLGIGDLLYKDVSGQRRFPKSTKL